MTLARLLYGRVTLIKQTLNSLLCAFKAKIDADERVSNFAKWRPKFVAKNRCGLIFETCWLMIMTLLWCPSDNLRLHSLLLLNCRIFNDHKPFSLTVVDHQTEIIESVVLDSNLKIIVGPSWFRPPRGEMLNTDLKPLLSDFLIEVRGSRRVGLAGRAQSRSGVWRNFVQLYNSWHAVSWFSEQLRLLERDSRDSLDDITGDLQSPSYPTQCPSILLTKLPPNFLWEVWGKCLVKSSY